MKWATFDLFDTLILRPFARPRDVWNGVARRLGVPDWSVARSNAEEEARMRYEGGEPTLEEIHALLPTGARWAGALEIELEEERACWKPNRRMVCEVERLRQEGRRIGFLSDTYFRSGDLRSWLLEHHILQADEPLWVSCELRASKHSGRAYEAVRRLAGITSDWVHFGDNAESDVRRARQAGVNGTLVETGFSVRENTFLAASSEAAARLRTARLGGDAGEEAVREWACAWAVFPHAYLRWIRQQVREHRADLVCFLARDGQVLHRLAGPEVEGVKTVYLPASRRAWRFAAAATGEDAFADWLRLGHDEKQAPALLPPSLGRPVPKAVNWGPWVHENREGLLEPAMKRQAEFLLHQWGDCGLLEARRPVFVDLGWSGSLQTSAERLFAQRGQSPMLLGLYLGLMTKGDSTRRGWAFQGSDVAPRVRHAVSVFEMLCSADHGTLCEYRPDGTPVWAPIPEDQAKQARRVQRAVMDACHALGGMEFDPRGLLEEWLGFATPEELVALRGMAFSPWAFDARETPALSPRRLLRLMSTRHRHLDEWPWPAWTLRQVFPRMPQSILSALLRLRESTWPQDA